MEENHHALTGFYYCFKRIIDGAEIDHLPLKVYWGKFKSLDELNERNFITGTELFLKFVDFVKDWE